MFSLNSEINLKVGVFLPLLTLISNFTFFLAGFLLTHLKINTLPIIYTLIFSMGVFVFNPKALFFQPAYLTMIILFLNWCLTVEFSSKNLIKVLNFIGKRTYGIFMGHFIIMIALLNFSEFEIIQSENNFIAKVVFFALVSAGAIFFGTLSYRFIEKPIFIYSGKKFRKSNKREI